jgi:photoactive yellow protein
VTTTTQQNPDNFKMHELQEVSAMGEEKLNALPFGAIKLDKNGTILSFNQYEAKLTGRDPNKVIGKNFFTEVAPCTNVQAFAGRYREGVEAGELHAVFPYKFDFKMAPRDVTVTLFYSKNTQQGWVFVREN